MKRKILFLLLASLLIPTSFKVYADEPPNDLSQIIISVPSDLDLSLNADETAYTKTASVSAKGSLSNYYHLEVSTDSSVTYVSSENPNVNGVVDFGTQSWTSSELEQSMNSLDSREISISVPSSEVQYGTYNSTVVFNINVVECEHNGGSAVRENEVEATCTAEGSYDEVVYCTECGKELSRTAKSIEKKSHTAGTAVEENRVEATCTTEGSYDEVVYCSSCGVELSRTAKVIPKVAHTVGTAVEENRVEATCTTEGSYDDVVYCGVCHEELSRTPKTIAKVAHTPTNAVRENIVDSTCSTEGSYDDVVYCGVCHEELSRTPKTIAKVAHTAGTAVQENEVAPTVEANGSYDEVVYCTVCGEEVSRTSKDIVPQEFTVTSRNFYMLGIPNTIEYTGKYLDIDDEYNEEEDNLLTGTVYGCEGDVNIPAIFKYDGVYYKTTSIYGVGDWKLGNVTLPKTITYIPSYAFCGSTIKSITFLGDLDYGYINGSSGAIDCSAFIGCTNLTSVEFRGKCTSIGYRAFCGCPITSIVLPEGLISIGDEAFYHSNLSSITFPSSLKTIYSGAFWGCTGLTSLIFSEGLTTIESSAFNMCLNLESITIPSSVTIINVAAFLDCRKLSIIKYSGTKKQFKTICSELSLGHISTTVKCSDGDLSVEQGHYIN